MGFLPPKFAKYESIAEAIRDTFKGNCSAFTDSENGFRVNYEGNQTIAYYWQANEPGNWGELSLSPVPLARDLQTSPQVIEDWMAGQKAINGNRKCEKHKKWAPHETPWPIIGFADRAELDRFLQAYRALRIAAFKGELNVAAKPAKGATPPKSSAAKLLEEFRALIASGEVSTSREVVREERVGQNLLRPVVLDMWENRCALTGIAHSDLLVTSHIKPWANSSDEERLDPYNALPLAAHIDAAFDAGLISFQDDGSIILSGELAQADRVALGLTPEARLRNPPTDGFWNYLYWHRMGVLRQVTQ